MRSDARPKKTGPEDTTPRATEETEFYTNIKFFVERLSTLADIFRPTSTPSDAGSTKTRKRRYSHSPTHTAKPRTQSPVKEEAATPTPAIPKAATRHRARSMTSTTKHRSQAPKIQSEDAPTTAVIPETMANKDEKTRRRAGSVVLPDYRAESKEFIKPLREHAGDWKAHYDPILFRIVQV